MAARSKSSEPEPETQDEERVVDPPEASDESAGAADYRWVIVDQSGMLTLPSGSAYNLNAGHTLQLSTEDAAFIVDQGYGSATDAPSEG